MYMDPSPKINDNYLERFTCKNQHNIITDQK